MHALLADSLVVLVAVMSCRLRKSRHKLHFPFVLDYRRPHTLPRPSIPKCSDTAASAGAGPRMEPRNVEPVLGLPGAWVVPEEPLDHYATRVGGVPQFPGTAPPSQYRAPTCGACSSALSLVHQVAARQPCCATHAIADPTARTGGNLRQQGCFSSKSCAASGVCAARRRASGTAGRRPLPARVRMQSARVRVVGSCLAGAPMSARALAA